MPFDIQAFFVSCGGFVSILHYIGEFDSLVVMHECMYNECMNYQWDFDKARN